MYGKSEDADDYQRVPRPVTALAVDYPDGHRVPRHRHERTQLVYARCGVVVAGTDAGTWVLPPLRALWVPAGTDHWLRTVGRCEVRTLYLDPAAVPHLPGGRAANGRSATTSGCAVVEVSPLLRELVVAAARIPILYDPAGRDGLVMALALRELVAVPVPGLHLPMPRDPRLRAVCQAIVARPAADRTLGEWARRASASPRTLARLFVAQTGMTFGRWRQQARLLASLPRLARGDSVLRTSLELGYASPSAFAAMFRAALGVSPSEYFRQARGREPASGA